MTRPSHNSRHLSPAPPHPAVRAPEQLGREHAHGGRHHHDPRRRRGPAPAAPPRAHPGGKAGRGGRVGRLSLQIWWGGGGTAGCHAGIRLACSAPSPKLQVAACTILSTSPSPAFPFGPTPTPPGGGGAHHQEGGGCGGRDGGGAGPGARPQGSRRAREAGRHHRCGQQQGVSGQRLQACMPAAAVGMSCGHMVVLLGGAFLCCMFHRCHTLRLPLSQTRRPAGSSTSTR